ncbi:hypothetical protein GOBAR_AA08123 [Gossypium barbadense]|uniref:Uncharacterized protein n=1 Tax=Gossypium barbadense TaxID=3634 RepID=A0A2P5YA98_GOSBA|nr:hypothetical protein GOBAR_AA08123 [Gossypium barbadense]
MTWNYGWIVGQRNTAWAKIGRTAKRRGSGGIPYLRGPCPGLPIGEEARAAGREVASAHCTENSMKARCLCPSSPRSRGARSGVEARISDALLYDALYGGQWGSRCDTQGVVGGCEPIVLRLYTMGSVGLY